MFLLIYFVYTRIFSGAIQLLKICIHSKGCFSLLLSQVMRPKSGLALVFHDPDLNWRTEYDIE